MENNNNMLSSEKPEQKSYSEISKMPIESQKDIINKLHEEQSNYFTLFNMSERLLNSQIDNNEKAESEVRFSVTNKILDKSKVVIAKTPQKICDLSNRILKSIRKKTAELVKKAEKSFNDFEEKNNRTLDEINKVMDQLFDIDKEFKDDTNLSANGRYMERRSNNLELERQHRRFSVESLKGYVVAELRPGVIRMLNMPIKVADKLIKITYSQEIPQTSRTL